MFSYGLEGVAAFVLEAKDGALGVGEGRVVEEGFGRRRCLGWDGFFEWSGSLSGSTVEVDGSVGPQGVDGGEVGDFVQAFDGMGRMVSMGLDDGLLGGTLGIVMVKGWKTSF